MSQRFSKAKHGPEDEQLFREGCSTHPHGWVVNYPDWPQMFSTWPPMLHSSRHFIDRDPPRGQYWTSLDKFCLAEDEHAELEVLKSKFGDNLRSCQQCFKP